MIKKAKFGLFIVLATALLIQLSASNVMAEKPGAWRVEAFNNKFDLNKNNLSLFASSENPYIAYSNSEEIGIIERKSSAWDTKVFVSNADKNRSFWAVKLYSSKGSQPTLTYLSGDIMKPEVQNTLNLVTPENSNGKKYEAEKVFGRIKDIRNVNGKNVIVTGAGGTITEVYECDGVSLVKAHSNGSHFLDAKIASNGKIYGVSKWLPIKGKSMETLHFSEMKSNRDSGYEIIRGFESGLDQENVIFNVMLAGNQEDVFSVVYFSDKEFFRGIRKTNSPINGVTDGNWDLFPYDRSEFNDLSQIIAYELGSNKIAYMLYKAKGNRVHLARFMHDNRCVIDNLGEGTAVSLAVDLSGNPHVLYQDSTGMLKYATCIVDVNENVIGGKKITIRDATMVENKITFNASKANVQQPDVTPIKEVPFDELPIGKVIPGKDGFVFSPYSNKILDVRGIKSGTVVVDTSYPPQEKKYFRVP